MPSSESRLIAHNRYADIIIKSLNKHCAPISNERPIPKTLGVQFQINGVELVIIDADTFHAHFNTKSLVDQLRRASDVGQYGREQAAIYNTPIVPQDHSEHASRGNVRLPPMQYPPMPYSTNAARLPFAGVSAEFEYPYPYYYEEPQFAFDEDDHHHHHHWRTRN
jgi:hypothetical protein